MFDKPINVIVKDEAVQAYIETANWDGFAWHFSVRQTEKQRQAGRLFMTAWHTIDNLDILK